MSIAANGVLIAIIAHGLIGISLIWDKILLKESAKQSVVNYVFWLGGMSVFGCILAVFGMKLPGIGVVLIAFGAGILHLIANYFYYWALKSGEASQTLSIMGGFSPLATALIAIPILGSRLHGLVLWGFALMVAGGFAMFLSQKINTRKVLPLVLLSAGFFGLTNVLQKWAFDRSGFITGYVFFTIGTFACALFFLIRTKWRQEIFTQSSEAQPKNKFWYFVNRFISGVGSFLIFFAISRANPAVVDAIAGLRYAIIFIGAFLMTKYWPNILKEKFTGWTLAAKTVATLLVIAGLVLVGLTGRGGGGGPSAWLRVPEGMGSVDKLAANFYTSSMDVHFSADVQAKLDRIASESGRDAEAFVREAVERAIGYDEWFIREVEKGLAAADRGEFVEHEEVRKLITSRYQR